MARRGRLRLLLVLAVFLLAIQLYPARIRPRETDPALFIETSLPVSGRIGALLRRSCYDCHGGPTRMPRYGRVAPASWLVAHDVNESMEHLDFSRWGCLDARKQAQLVEEMGEAVRDREMPPRRYLWLHGDARLGAAERETFFQWSRAEAARRHALRGGPEPRESAHGERVAPGASTRG